jgi:general secretion pathway protein L
MIWSAVVDGEQHDIAQRLEKGRAAASAEQAALTRSHQLLERHKHEQPFTAMVVEDLSRILPDNTYLTELRIEGNKLQLVGMTREAPALIALLEKSGRFARASFSGPTTRMASDLSERFHIEAIVEPNGEPHAD